MWMTIFNYGNWHNYVYCCILSVAQIAITHTAFKSSFIQKNAGVQVRMFVWALHYTMVKLHKAVTQHTYETTALLHVIL